MTPESHRWDPIHSWPRAESVLGRAAVPGGQPSLPRIYQRPGSTSAGCCQLIAGCRVAPG
jgi:hypothetical protein